jgi:hypothetical protein
MSIHAIGVYLGPTTVKSGPPSLLDRQVTRAGRTLVFLLQERGGRAIAVLALNIADDHVQTIHAVANPEKLHHLSRVRP